MSLFVLVGCCSLLEAASGITAGSWLFALFKRAKSAVAVAIGIIQNHIVPRSSPVSYVGNPLHPGNRNKPAGIMQTIKQARSALSKGEGI